MTAKREHAKTFAEIVNEVPEKRASAYQVQSLNVIAHGEWLDHEGTYWRMRGEALDSKHARRLLARPDLTIAHFDCYGPNAVVAGSEREALLERVYEFLEVGPVGGGNGFGLAEFRDGDGNVTLVVEGDCC